LRAGIATAVYVVDGFHGSAPVTTVVALLPIKPIIPTSRASIEGSIAIARAIAIAIAIDCDFFAKFHFILL
jgi:hypothetical protein